MGAGRQGLGGSARHAKRHYAERSRARAHHDAKYYAATSRSATLTRWERCIRGNLYQIFAYVKNKQAALERAGESVEASGMLLYAATDEEVQPDFTYRMSGNQIGVRTLDLDRPLRRSARSWTASLTCSPLRQPRRREVDFDGRSLAGMPAGGTSSFFLWIAVGAGAGE